MEGGWAGGWVEATAAQQPNYPSPTRPSHRPLPPHLSAATRSLSDSRVPTAAPTSRRPSGATEGRPGGSVGGGGG